MGQDSHIPKLVISVRQNLPIIILLLHKRIYFCPSIKDRTQSSFVGFFGVLFLTFVDQDN